MNRQPFVFDELREDKVRDFVNGDEPACDKNLTDPMISDMAFKAAFWERPAYAKQIDRDESGACGCAVC